MFFRDGVKTVPEYEAMVTDATNNAKQMMEGLNEQVAKIGQSVEKSRIKIEVRDVHMMLAGGSVGATGGAVSNPAAPRQGVYWKIKSIRYQWNVDTQAGNLWLPVLMIGAPDLMSGWVFDMPSSFAGSGAQLTPTSTNAITASVTYPELYLKPGQNLYLVDQYGINKPAKVVIQVQEMKELVTAKSHVS